MIFKQIISTVILMLISCFNYEPIDNNLIGIWQSSVIIIGPNNNSNDSQYVPVTNNSDTLTVSKKIEFTSNQAIVETKLFQSLLGLPDSIKIFNYSKSNDTLTLNWTDISTATYLIKFKNGNLIIDYLFGTNIVDHEIITGNYKRVR